MLRALSLAEARAIADLAARASRDEKAMVAYLNVGTRGRRRPAPARLDLVAADPAAFDSPERRRLEARIAALEPEARLELIALTWLARTIGANFARALRQARRVPIAAQTGYLAGKPLERHIPAALDKLGLKV
jgi:Protein of unknown function (DUF3775)